MTGKEYVELAMRTNDGNATGRIEKAIELLRRRGRRNSGYD